MAELLKNPSKLARVRKELEEAIRLPGQEMEESDIARLPYLQAVLKEVLRLHPPGPLLLPHRVVEAGVELGGYAVPEGARVLVNVWAMGRDDEVWAEPEDFAPERFLGRDVDFRGRDFELIPFGSGRRLGCCLCFWPRCCGRSSGDCLTGWDPPTWTSRRGLELRLPWPARYGLWPSQSCDGPL